MQLFTSKAKLSNFGTQKGLAKTLKFYLKSKILTCNLPLFLILHTYVYYHCPKSMEMTILHDFVTIYIMCVSMSVEQFYNLQYPPRYKGQMCLGGWKNKTVNLHTTITMVEIDHTIRPLLTHMVPPCTSKEKHSIFEWG